MPRYDLNGNIVPDDGPTAQAGQTPATAPQGQQYDLAGNPLPARQAAPIPPPGSGAGQSPYGAPPNTYRPPSGPPSSTGYDREFVYTDRQPEPQGKIMAKLAIGSVIALALAIAGSIGIMKLLLASGFGFGLIYVALGWAVGLVMSYATTKKGLSVGLTFAFLAIGLFAGHYSYVADSLHKLGLDGTPVMSAFGTVMGTLKPMHWLLLLVAVSAGLRGASTEIDGHS